MLALEGDTYDASPQHQMTRRTRRFAALGITTGEQSCSNQDVAREGHVETAASPVLPSANALGRISEARLRKAELCCPRSTGKTRAEAGR